MAYPDFNASTFALVLYNWRTTTRDHGDADLESLRLTLADPDADVLLYQDIRDFIRNANDFDEWAPFFLDMNDPASEDRWAELLMRDFNLRYEAVQIYHGLLNSIWLPAHQKDFTHLTD